MTSGVAIIGSAMTSFGRHPPKALGSLARSAMAIAIEDAGIPTSDIGIVFFANAIAGVMEGQEMIRGQAFLRELGDGAPMVNVENACASSSTAVYLAAQAIRSQAFEVAIVVGAEQMTHSQKGRTYAALGTALPLRDWPDAQAAVDRAVFRLKERDGEEQYPQESPFMGIYSRRAREYMSASGASVHDFAQVAVKNRMHASFSEFAQFKEPITVEDVLGGRLVADPLTLLMCSPIADGAASVVLSSERYAERTGIAYVKLAAQGLVSGRWGEDTSSSITRAAHIAYEQSGIGPEDLDVLELHDAAAPAELMAYEELGLCPLGEGPGLLASGRTRLGGDTLVNPSGGLLSRGHPIGATGVAQLVELVAQLRGHRAAMQERRPRVALAENSGGYIGGDAAVTCVTVLHN